MDKSRKKNSMRNMVIGISLLVLSYVITFTYRIFFLKILDIEYLGAAGLVTSVIGVLSITESGIGVTIVYFLYKPLSEGNQDKVAGIVRFLRHCYLLIAGLVLLIGLALAPFLHFFIKGEITITPSITVVYLFFLASSVISYFSGPKSILLAADQSDYINKLITNSVSIFLQVLAIVFLHLTKMYLAVVIIINLGCIFNLVIITIVANKRYPYLKDKTKTIDSEEKKKIFKYAGSVFLCNIGYIVSTSVCNIIISTFIGVVMLGIYSNYLVIVTAINSILTIVYASVSASVGNFIAEKPKEEQYKLYESFNLLCNWLAVFAASGLFFVSSSLITIWLGAEYVMDMFPLLVVSSFFLFENMARTNGVFVGTLGLVPRTVPATLVFPIITFVGGIVFVQFFDLAGAFMGTILARVVVYPYEAYVVNKYGFKQKLNKYYKNYFYYLILGAISVGLILLVTQWNIVNPYADFAYRFFVCVLIPNLVFLVGNYKTRQFNMLMQFLPFKIRRAK